MKDAWLLAARPRTLPLSVAPILMGCAFAFRDGFFKWPVALLALSVSMLLQIATNFANDYFDHHFGVDTAERVGPKRATSSGLIRPVHMLIAALSCFSFAGVLGLYLIYVGGPWFCVLGAVAILSGLLYTAGPKSIGYLGFSELFVIFFYGPVAVVGTYYLQTHALNAEIIIASLAPGFLACGPLIINYIRDIEQDRKAGRKTLAVRFGIQFGKYEYATIYVVAAIIPIVLNEMFGRGHGSVFAIFVLLAAYPLVKEVWHTHDPVVYNRILPLSAKVALLYVLVFSLGILW